MQLSDALAIFSGSVRRSATPCRARFAAAWQRNVAQAPPHIVQRIEPLAGGPGDVGDGAAFVAVALPFQTVTHQAQGVYGIARFSERHFDVERDAR